MREQFKDIALAIILGLALATLALHFFGVLVQ
jgi:hypothetical protein